MDNSQEALIQYVADQRRSGFSDEIIHHTLVSNGWPEETVAGILMQNSPHVPYPLPQTLPPTTPATNNKGIFTGRIGRLGFLLGGLYPLLILVIMAILNLLIHYSRIMNMLSILVGMVVIIAVIPISIGLHIRRWHDLNQSGWLTLLGLIPFVGPLVTLLLLILPGSGTINNYGQSYDGSLSPKDIYGLRRT